MGGEELRAVLPLGHGALWAWQARPWTMGILNVTPDSFSDGGTYLEVTSAARTPCFNESAAKGTAQSPNCMNSFSEQLLQRRHLYLEVTSAARSRTLSFQFH